MEVYLRSMSLMGEVLDLLRPGDDFDLLVHAEGSRLNLRMLQAPAYLEEFGKSLSNKPPQ